MTRADGRSTTRTMGHATVKPADPVGRRQSRNRVNSTVGVDRAPQVRGDGASEARLHTPRALACSGTVNSSSASITVDWPVPVVAEEYELIGPSLGR
jgi:hypothetical protein